MFTDQITMLVEQENDLTNTIETSQAIIDGANSKLSLVKKARKALEKLQEQSNGQTTVPNE